MSFKFYNNLWIQLNCVLLVTDKTVAIARSGYNHKPSFNFSSPTKFTSLLNIPKSINYKNFKNDTARFQAKTESNKVNIKAQVIAQIQTTSGGLANISEHILPSNIQDRLRLQPYHCIGSLVKNPNERCSNKARRPLACVDGNLGTMTSFGKDLHTMKF